MKYGGMRRWTLFALCWVGAVLTLQAEDLVTLNGLTYTNITISRIEPDAIRILHSAGAARIPASQLPALFKTQHALTFTDAPKAEEPQNIVTTSGKTYAGAVVKRVEPDRIMVIYKEGATVIPMTDLPPEMQQKYNFDPVKAKAYADNRAAAEDSRVNALLRTNSSAGSAHPASSPAAHSTSARPMTAIPSSSPRPMPATAATSAPAPTPTVVASAPSAEPAPAAEAQPDKVMLEDLVVLAQEIDLVGEEERSRVGGTVNWRPATEYYYYYDYYWYNSQKRDENAARRKKLDAAKGNRLTWAAGAAKAKSMLRTPMDTPPLKSWLEKFIATSELAGTNRRDDYHHKCKELKDDLDFLLKAAEKPAP